MKTMKTLLLILCSSLATGLYSQDNNTAQIHPANKMVSEKSYAVPQEVQADFDARYPGTEISSLETSKAGYKIGFTKNDKNYYTTYDLYNNWISTSEEITYEELPDEAKNSFMGTSYANYQVNEVNKVSNGEKPTYYQMNIENAGTTRNLYFSEDGTLLDELNQESPSSTR